MTLKEILQAALAKLNGGRNWTKGIEMRFERMDTGKEEPKYCAIGAVRAVCSDWQKQQLAFSLLSAKSGIRDIVALNDMGETPFSKVEDAYRLAIDAADKAEALAGDSLEAQKVAAEKRRKLTDEYEKAKNELYRKLLEQTSELNKIPSPTGVIAQKFSI